MMVYRVFLFCAALMALMVGGAATAQAEIRLVMVDQPGCVYCDRWDAEIAPGYPNTAEGRFAPLLRADLRSGPPEGVNYDRRVVFTPTFILIKAGEELARMEGYPGEDFFWPLLSKMLADNTNFADTSQDAPVRN